MQGSVFFEHLPLFFTAMITIGCLIYVIHCMKKTNAEFMKLIQTQNDNLVHFKESMVDQSNKSLTSIVDALKDGKGINEAISGNASLELAEIFSKIKRVYGENLYKTLMKTNACRTAIYLFHNGTRAIHGGFNFIKLSCVAEKCLGGSGVKERIFQQSNMQVNIFDEMYEKLLESERYVFIRDPNNEMQASVAEFISSPKIKYSQAVCLYDSGNNLLRFVLAEFDHVYDVHTADEEYDKIKDLCKTLLPIFSYAEYTDVVVKSSTTEENNNENA